MAISAKPIASKPRRGLISAHTSGSDFQAFLRFALLDSFEGSFSGAMIGSDYLRLLDAGGRTKTICQRPTYLAIFIGLPPNRGWNEKGALSVARCAAAR